MGIKQNPRGTDDKQTKFLSYSLAKVFKDPKPGDQTDKATQA